MMEEYNREKDRKRHPDFELLCDVEAGVGIEQKKARDRNEHGGGIIDVNGTDEIARFALELQTAFGAVGIHSEGLLVQ